MQWAAEAREADAVKQSRQHELLQASRDTLQKQLATTETEFRLALQVSLPSTCPHNVKLLIETTDDDNDKCNDFKGNDSNGSNNQNVG